MDVEQRNFTDTDDPLPLDRHLLTPSAIFTSLALL